MLDEDECYLAAILDDPSGIELAEFCWTDETPGKPDPCFRVWDFQWSWYHNEATYQIDQAGRSLGKSMGILMRAFAFPFNYPGQEMLITAPELNHLGPIVDKVEDKFLTIRLGREMLPRQKGGGVKHQPQFQASFTNGAVIMGRLPQRDGKGVKGSLGAGALVLTRRGQVPIEDVRVGDEVWTHNGRWRPVEHKVEYFNEHVVTVTGGGHRGLVMSDNHRMMTRRNRNPQRARNLESPSFTVMADLDDPERHYLGSPTRFPDEGIPAGLDNDALLWVLGRYVADGYLARKGRVGTRLHIICRAEKRDDTHLMLVAAGLRPSSRLRENGTYDVEVSSRRLCELVAANFGELAQHKRLPFWLLGCRDSARRAFLDGYLGDGHWNEARHRWEVGTASKALAVGLRLLGQSLGYGASMSWVDPKVTQVRGRQIVAEPRRSWRVQLQRKGHALIERQVAWRKVRSVIPARPCMVYDLVVADDHSYLADGLISHNQHPLVLESDEMQDYPRQGWVELIETMKSSVPGAQWRAHGVSRGVRDEYYRMTQNQNPDLPWHVHRYMAMHRPGWSDAERRAKIAIYGGSRDNPDYKRNIYGEHGDVTNPVFVLARLMACVRINESTWASEYNDNVYALRKLEYEAVEGSGMPIEAHLRLPANHQLPAYKSYWGGMDIGYTNDPSELLIFGLLRQGDRDLLRLLTRIHMMRISAPNQAAVINAVANFYGDRLRALSMDKTGNGLPIWQETTRGGRLHKHAVRIKGYGFSEKKAVEFDDRPLERKERPEDAVIEKNVIEYATDELRSLVDGGLVELPFDQELLTEFQGQTVVYGGRDEGVQYGGKRTRYGGGSFHTLDAAKLAVLGKSLESIEAVLNKPRRHGPVLDQFGY